MANFWCDNEGNVYLKGNIYATDGVFRGTVYATDGEFTGTVYATDGKFEGIVQADDFLDSAGNSMLDNGKFDAKYLSLYGLTVTKKDSSEITFAVPDYVPQYEFRRCQQILQGQADARYGYHA